MLREVESQSNSKFHVQYLHRVAAGRQADDSCHQPRGLIGGLWLGSQKGERDLIGSSPILTKEGDPGKQGSSDFRLSRPPVGWYSTPVVTQHTMSNVGILHAQNKWYCKRRGVPPRDGQAQADGDRQEHPSTSIAG